MQININSAPSFSPAQGQNNQQNVALTSEQRSLVEETLAQYQSENLSTEQAQEIYQNLSSAKIPAGEELASLMAEQGFDARKVGDAGRPPPPPPSSEGQGALLNIDSNELVNYLDELLTERQNSGEKQSVESLLEQINARFGTQESPSLASIKV